MGSNLNFKNFGNGENSGARPIANSPLIRQSSVYSLTFDEFQSTLGGGMGKDLGSMNMDELLKNIWTAEETNTTTTNNSSTFPDSNPNLPSVDLQRQGSLTLPRTLSQKTVDEVWRGLVKENESVPTNLPQAQRQPTLGEMTLEEFLARAGVVRDDNNTQAVRKENNVGFFDEFSRLNSNNGLGLQFQPNNRNNELMSTQMLENNNNFGLRSAQPHQQPLFPKPANVAFATPMNLVNNGQLPSPRMRASVVGMVDQPMNNNLVQGGGMNNMVGLATGGVRVATASPVNRISPNLIPRDTPSLSPVPTMFGRGRKGAALEKVIERRHKRMIKNRESAARSRARKQAYTMELEAEVAKLKEVNQELQKKQAEIIETQKTRFFEKINRKWGSKRQYLWRTLTGPW